MRAIVADGPGGPEVLRESDVPTPEPTLGEVLVKVHAIGTNPVDWKTRSGRGSAPLFGDPPWILGWDVAGTVARLGPGVTRFDVGDRVFGLPRFPHPAGAYAEYLTAPPRHLVRTPNSLDDVSAAGLPNCGLTAWQALFDTANLQAGQRVLIHGAGGGVGHLAVQLARWRGAEVIGTASAGKHEVLKELGAEQLIDYRTTDFEDVVDRVDVVLDTVGGDYPQRSLAVLKPGGTLVALASRRELPSGENAATKRCVWMLVEPDHHELSQLADLVERGELTVRIERTAPLSEAAAVHAHLERGGSFGKSVLLTDDDEWRQP
jgi:NADPH:quinone reductase-like Zn-dependent oxidoreductase